MITARTLFYYSSVEQLSIVVNRYVIPHEKIASTRAPAI